ncbi:MAG: hypothetical protein N3F09_10430 [Bacteroidia bacterium]|nr:hypothetical protein [Bacteroidia bacterium]
MCIFVSCKPKKFPVDNQIPDDDEILYFKGEVNGNYTEVILNSPDYQNNVSIQKDSLNVYVYSSGFSNLTCSTCNEIFFEFRDNQPSSPTSNGNFQQWMFQGAEFGFYNISHSVKFDTSHVLSFKGWGNKQNLTYTYIFGDGGISYAPNPIYTYHQLRDYLVKFYTYDPATQNQSSIENKIKLSNLKKNFYYYIKLDTVVSLNQMAVFSAKSIFSGNDPLVQYWWNTGSGYIQGSSNKSIQFSMNTLYKISLRVVKNTDTSESHYLFVYNNPSISPTILTSNFHVNSYVMMVNQFSNMFLGQTNISMKYNNGKLYQTKYAGDANDKFKIKIIHVQDIPSPMEGFLAKRVKFKFDADLLSIDNKADTLKIRNGEAKLIFLYKNSRL